MAQAEEKKVLGDVEATCLRLHEKATDAEHVTPSVEKLRLTRTNPDDVIVDTRLISGLDLIPISFRVLKRAGANLIIDVLAEGTSILVTQRDEFAAVIKATGSVAGLTEKLKTIQ